METLTWVGVAMSAVAMIGTWLNRRTDAQAAVRDEKLKECEEDRTRFASELATIKDECRREREELRALVVGLAAEVRGRKPNEEVTNAGGV